MAVLALAVSAGEAMASSKGAAGFTKATQEVSSYQTPVEKPRDFDPFGQAGLSPLATI